MSNININNRLTTAAAKREFLVLAITFALVLLLLPLTMTTTRTKRAATAQKKEEYYERRRLVSYGPLSLLDEFEMSALVNNNPAPPPVEPPPTPSSAAEDTGRRGGSSSRSQSQKNSPRRVVKAYSLPPQAEAASSASLRALAPNVVASLMAIGQRTVALFEVDRLQPTPQTSSYKVLRARTVMGSSSQKYPFCQSEQKQVVQPLGAFCSGILLTESLVATAAHCLDGGMAAASQFCSSGRLVFARNYAVTTKTNGGGGGEQLGNVSRSNDDDDEEGVVQANMGPIARCKEVVAYARGKSLSTGIHLDYAVLRLDKPLLPTTVDDAMLPPLDLVDPAAVFSATNSNLQSLRLLAIGHPSGMPRKYGLDGRWISRIDPEPPIVSSRKIQGDDNGNASPNDVVNLWSRVLTIAQSSALSSSSSTDDSSSAAIMTPRKPTRHVVSVDAFRGSSGGPVIAYTNSRVLGLAGILTGGHTYDYLVSDEEPGGCLRTNHCREMVTGKLAAAVRCDDGSLSAGEVMHDASYFAPWIGTEKSSPPPPPPSQSPDDPICNGRGTLVDSEKFTCSCNEGYNGTLCDRIVTQHGCLCDPPDLWPDGPEKMVARMRMRGGGSSTSPASSSSPSPVLQNRDQLCPPTSQLSLRISRCFVDARSCLASPASDPQKAVPFGAIRAPSVAWDYCS